MTAERIKNIVEAALFAAVQPLSMDNLMDLFGDDEERPDRNAVRDALRALQDEWRERGIELVEVSTGFRFQVRKEYSSWVGRLWAERPARYSRALLETLALIAYRQPITRGEIEEVRGVTLSYSIMKTLLEREWIRVVGHRDVPGRPALYGTTRSFLDDFNLKSLGDLPPLDEIRDLDAVPDLFAQAGAGPGTRTGTEAPAPEQGGALTGVDAQEAEEPTRAEEPPAQAGTSARSEPQGSVAAHVENGDDEPQAEPHRPPRSEDAAPQSPSEPGPRSGPGGEAEARTGAEDDDTETEAQCAKVSAH
ncbi:MAG: SMC-Scp complex subunit ScpB [Gammaproteobacteria bacterium]|nr:SMC-Scp complex subunit ScpB [Gammaproteobacteria bacterium]NIR81650.1 SMC-Scp complex subunit ScpB [Gammaproteobacteria bacterium]NIR88201.1 SMC-Scp complex subunit ScpB [Gammaproteobacteria bacterium]NIU02762.1 SMC-Scp complex subunit ScpB [Gammaproteobacteria bacterium]NIV73361.1 SMC-Scp complex subunit ScpB [Gammaproteobacteria bacterium]